MALSYFIPTVWSETLYRELDREFVAVKNCSRDFEGDIKNVGDTVKLKDDVNTYYPDGKPFSAWVRDYYYCVDRVADKKGEPVYRNGDRCVLLGEKINKKSGAHGSSINSWASINYIEKVRKER